MTEGVITLERVGAVAHVSLNRPQVLNAIDDRVCHALLNTVRRLEDEPTITTLVISGQGDRAFSAGADIRHMRTLESGVELRRFIELTWRALEGLASSRLISVAALHGHVLGGGLELALACDLRIGDETVCIGLPELSLGSVPGSGAMQRLPRLIGTARTLELIVMGRRLTAQQAAQQGIINSVVTPGRATPEALVWADKIASHSAEALRYLKASLQGELDAKTAATMHGLISSACHQERNYQANTQRFSSAVSDRKKAEEE